MTLATDALDQAQRLSSKAVTSLTHHHLGLLLSRRGQHRAALPHFDAALRLRRNDWQRWAAAETLVARAKALVGLGEICQARNSYDDAVAILEALNDPRALDVRSEVAALDTLLDAS